MPARIAAARFATEAKRAIAALDAGFADDAVYSFHVTPQGRRAMYPIGGDDHHDRGTRQAAHLLALAHGAANSDR